jgi:glycosyltransferase involved in cell wall biosynthesis
MTLGIDATNIRTGGGLTHLLEVLKETDISSHGFSKVVIWSSDKTLAQISNKEWLIKESNPMLNNSFLHSFLYQILYLSRSADKIHKCDLLFVPGGSFLGYFKKIVSFSQNMLPFEKKESKRFSRWQDRLRFKILFFTQKYTFKRSKGVIFLTKYAQNYITNSINLKSESIIIPHGINPSFTAKPRLQQPISEYTFVSPFKLLYVSIITVYKHQWNVALAVLKLREEGYPIELDLIGGSTQESLDLLNIVLKSDINKVVNYRGLIPYEELGDIYKNANAFVFASSCENMPIILIEAMTAGLPIVSSNMGPMPEVLGDSAFFFNPLDVNDIYYAIKKMLDSNDLRTKKVESSFSKSINYTWQSCSHKTFEYLSKVAKTN